ncbi:hypothetical protein BKA70DRAFT_1246381 [Coprinopsis sp. MPI-PUGE-AT-0042]|nr:hypothetical protein BKA70DRAFT_1246381 [Coprinopsis sp. MPI-PUGE-AT-0042]
MCPWTRSTCAALRGGLSSLLQLALMLLPRKPQRKLRARSAGTVGDTDTMKMDSTYPTLRGKTITGRTLMTTLTTPNTNTNMPTPSLEGMALPKFASSTSLQPSSKRGTSRAWGGWSVEGYRRVVAFLLAMHSRFEAIRLVSLPRFLRTLIQPTKSIL